MAQDFCVVNTLVNSGELRQYPSATIGWRVGMSRTDETSPIDIEMSLWLSGNRRIWGTTADNATPDIVDAASLLHFLGRNWLALHMERVVPGTGPNSPPLQGHRALETLHALASEGTWRPDGPAWASWLLRHDLANSQPGVSFPMCVLWMDEEGEKLHVATATGVSSFEAELALGALVELAKTLSEILSQRLQEGALSSPDSERAHSAMVAWRQRDSIRLADIRRLLSATGLADDESVLPQAFRDAAPQEKAPLLLAARRLGGLSADARTRVLADIAGLSPSPITAEARLAREAAAIRLEDICSDFDIARVPYLQGYELATWARARFGLANEPIADPFAFMARLGIVPVRRSWTMAPSLRAAAVWSGSGVMLILNTPDQPMDEVTRLSQSFDLAHEFCHFLVDWPSASLAAEALLDNYDPAEKRANAFAAEWLLPQQAIPMDAGVMAAQDADQAILALRRMATRWQVNYTIACLQAHNGCRNDRITLPPCVRKVAAAFGDPTY
jgi:hypothetical protein